MRSYVPNAPAVQEQMLRAIGVGSVEELFADIPAAVRLERPLDLPGGKSEQEVRRLFAAYGAATQADWPVFRGAGAYRHYIPAAVPQLASISSFYTAYTPYQPEISQGMLQVIFEYQTYICQLTGMDASNASVYDGATAAAEAMLMLSNIKRKAEKVLYSAGLHPHVRQVLHTYARFAGIELCEIALNDQGLVDMAALAAQGQGAAGFIAAQPNFYGGIDNLGAIADAVHAWGGLLVACVNPIAMGCLQRPGDCGADIAVGDGQPLGLPLNFGGPYLGFMAAKSKYIRYLPGRIAGQTQDAQGRRVFVLTLQAREQHIRREKASSNICSNQALCALSASVYLSLMGPQGLRDVADQCMQKARYLARGIAAIPGMRLRHSAPFFHEFVVDSHIAPEVIDAALCARHILGGAPLSLFDPGDKGILYCATEMNTREEMDALLSALEEVAK